MRHFLPAVMLICLTPLASAGVFQFTTPIPTENHEHAAFLWLPPEATEIRGVVVAGMTLMEAYFAQDPIVRAACAEQQLALVFTTCGLGSYDVQRVLDDLAARSGYAELAVAPLFFVGHSAGGPQAREKAIKHAERCFGLMQFRGGTPGDGPAGPGWVPAGIPCLVMMGQFDEFGGMMRDADGRESWQRVADVVAGYRAANPANLVALAVEPGAGHFAWSDRNATLFAAFLKAAAEARIPAARDAHAQQPPTLQTIDPQTGYLTSLDLLDEDSPQPAPIGDYTGDAGRASWHFNRALAEATVAYHAGLDKKDQFIRWEDGTWVDAGVRHFFTGLKWVEPGDVLQVHPTYRDTYPPNADNGQGPRWAAAGQPVGRSDAPIRVVPVAGPLEAVGEHQLRLTFSALFPADARHRATFLALSEGDHTFRHTEQVGMMPRGFKGLGGKAQTITFPPPDSLKADGQPITLNATSDADLPVRYYIAHGPATIEGNQLRITELPKRAKRPVEVKVVAYQPGRGLDPKVATAAPVAHTLHITE